MSNKEKIQTIIESILVVGAYSLWIEKFSFLTTTFILIVAIISILNNRKISLKIDKYTLVVIIYTITIFFNVFVSTDVQKSYVFSKFLIAMLFMIVVMKDKISDDIIVSNTYMFMTLMLILSIIWEYVNFETFREFGKKILSEDLWISISTNRGSFDRYVGFGVYAGPTSCMIIYGMCAAHCYLKKDYKYYLFMLLGLISIFLTGSRIQLLMFFIIIIIYKLLLISKKEKKNTAFVILNRISIIALVIIFVMLFSSEITKVDLRLISSGMSSASVIARFALYKYAFDLFLKNPVIGTGINTFLNYSTENQLVENTYAHNLLLQSLAEQGICGATILIVFIGISFYYTFKNYKNNKDNGAYKFSLLVQLVFIIYSLSGNPFYDTNLRMLYMIGIIIGLKNNKGVKVKNE